MIFEFKEDSEFLDGLELSEEFIKIILGIFSYVIILVRSNIDRNIVIKRRIELGRVYMVKLVLSILNFSD